MTCHDKKKLHRSRAEKIKKLCCLYNINTNIEDILSDVEYNFQL